MPRFLVRDKGYLELLSSILTGKARDEQGLEWRRKIRKSVWTDLKCEFRV